MGAALTVFAGLLLAVRGPKVLGQQNLTFGSIAALYLLGGGFGGLLLGLLRPLVKWRWGAALTGILIAIPFGLGIRLLDTGLSPWSTEDSLVLTFFSIGLGAPLGWIYWGISRSIPLNED